MKSKQILVVIFSIISTISIAQQKSEIEYSGFFDSYYFRGPIGFTADLGANFYFGDLSKRKIGQNLSLGMIYKTWPRIAFGGEFAVLLASATDHVPVRGYTYKGTNLGLTGYMRYYLRDDKITQHHHINHKKKFKPYLQFGLTGLYFKPKTTDLNGNQIKENVKIPVSLAIPVGIGFDFMMSNRITIAPEFLYYYTFSDNIDDIGEIHGGDSKDSYLTTGIKVTYYPFAPRTKRRKLSKAEIELLDKNVHTEGGAGNSANKKGNSDGNGALKDTETTEEYQSDDDLLQVEPQEEEIILPKDLEEENEDNPEDTELDSEDSDDGEEDWGW